MHGVLPGDRQGWTYQNADQIGDARCCVDAVAIRFYVVMCRV